MRSLVIALMAAIILVLMVAATNSVVSSARAISRDANALSRTDEAIRAATVARTMTILAAVAVNDGTTPPSLDEIDAAVEILRLDTRTPVESQAFTTAVTTLTDAISTGTRPAPDQVAGVENSFQDLLDAQVLSRSTLTSILESSENRLNRFSTLAGLALLFVVPTLSIAVYRGLTRPDIESQALALAANRDALRRDNQLRAVAQSVSELRTTITHNVAPAVADQRLAETAALVGVGADGALRRRRATDLRMAAASAVNRVEHFEMIPVHGESALVVADDEQLATMVAALLATIADNRDPMIQISSRDGLAKVTVSTCDVIDRANEISDPRPFNSPVDTAFGRHLASARSFAADLGVVITQLGEDDRGGFEVVFPLAESLASEAVAVGSIRS